jgi:uncharacterized protein
MTFGTTRCMANGRPIPELLEEKFSNVVESWPLLPFEMPHFRLMASGRCVAKSRSRCIIAETGLLRLSRLSLVIALCALPFGIFAVLNLPMGSAGVHQWLPEGRPERVRYEAFVQEFGSDQVLLCSWDGCTVNDPRLVDFKNRVARLPDYSLWFTRLEATDSVIASIAAPPLKLSVEKAKARVRGVMIGSGGTGCVVLGVSEQGVHAHKELIQSVRTVADETSGLGRDQLRMVGTVFEAYAVDEAAEASLQRYVVPSSILGFVFAALCLGSIRGALLVLILATFGQLVAIGLVYFTGNQFSAVLIVLPTLVFMLTLSGAIHLVNYFMEDHSPGCQDVAHRGVRSLVVGWQPCLLSSVTTMLGMGSLCMSHLGPVRQFGVFSAVSLGIATAFLLLAFPTIATWVLGFHSSPDSTQTDPATAKNGRNEPSFSWIRFPSRFIFQYSEWVGKHCSAIVAASILTICMASMGLAYLQSSTKFCDMFPPSSRTNTDMRWFETHVGPIANVEVLIHFSSEPLDDLLNQVRWVQVLCESLKQNEKIGGVLSAATFVPQWPTSSSLKAVMARSVLKKHLDSGLSDLEDNGLVNSEPNGRTWRLMCKVSAVSTSSYGEQTESIRKIVHETLDTQPIGTHRKPNNVEFTGLSPVMNDTQLALLQDLGLSFLSAFLLITPVMMWVVRSIRVGLLIMLPNIFPVTLAFGMMGWMGISLDIAGILTASVALGIAVDDTLHFVSWYKQELNSGCSRLEAVQKTLAACGNAMLHTTLISCSAMLPFMFSEFIPTGQFAKLMVVMLMGAIFGDMVILPAILLSPLGKMIASSEPIPCLQSDAV